MAYTSPYDPKTSEARSSWLAGLTEAMSIVTQQLNLEASGVETINLEELPIDDENQRKIYQAQEWNKLWLTAPKPVIKKDDVEITEETDHFTIDYLGGSIVFEDMYRPGEGAVITANVSHILGNSQGKSAALEAINKQLATIETDLGGKANESVVNGKFEEVNASIQEQKQALTTAKEELGREIDEKQGKLTGTQGQVVGFDENGNAVAEDIKVTSVNGKTGDVQLSADDLNAYTKDETAEVIAKAIEAAQGDEARLDALFGSMLDGKNTTRIFYAWWPLSESGGQDRYARLERFGKMLANAWSDKTYTVRGFNYNVSGDSTMTPLDDLAPLGKAVLATDTEPGGYDWAENDPMTWYVRGNAVSKADGTMDITAIEGVDGEFDITGETAPVYTFALALWWKETRDDQYIKKSWRTTRAAGFRPHVGDVGPDNEKRVLTWHPTFGGGFKDDGTTLTSGAGRKCANKTSATTGITDARKVNKYEGLWCDCDTDWLLGMWQLRHQNKENGGILEGCTKYNYQYHVAKQESNTTRVLLSKAEAANFVVGSTVSVGSDITTSNSNKDRNNITATDLANLVIITSIIDNVEENYSAIYLDLGEKSITTTENSYISTMPWHRGSTERVPGHKDGCIGNLTNGKYPARVAGIEVLDGAYAIGLDPLYDVAAGSGGKFNYTVKECRSSEKLPTNGNIPEGYIDTGITYTDMPFDWHYIKEFKENGKGVVFPSEIGGSDSTYYKSAFCGSSGAGVRCPWRFSDLSRGGLAGLASENYNIAPGTAHWAGVPRLSGSGKKRGEWTG